MKHFTLEDLPSDATEMRKTNTIRVTWEIEPFVIEEDNGSRDYGPQTDGWDDGYFIAWPSDGSKPYGISKAFVENNYEKV